MEHFSNWSECSTLQPALFPAHLSAIVLRAVLVMLPTLREWHGHVAMWYRLWDRRPLCSQFMPETSLIRQTPPPLLTLALGYGLETPKEKLLLKYSEHAAP